MSTKVYIGTTENVCLVCGEIVPEGREVCLDCEKRIMGVNKSNEGTLQNS